MLRLPTRKSASEEATVIENLAARRAWVQRVLGVNLPDATFTEAQIDQVGSAQPKIGQLVAYRQALLSYETARRNVHAQIELLSATIATTLPAEAEFADMLAIALADLNERVGDAVDRAMSAVGDGRAAANKAAAGTMRDAMTEINGNPLVRHVDGNPFVATSIADTLNKALGDLIATIH
jgi:hypothetical protein